MAGGGTGMIQTDSGERGAGEKFQFFHPIYLFNASRKICSAFKTIGLLFGSTSMRRFGWSWLTNISGFESSSAIFHQRSSLNIFESLRSPPKYSSFSNIPFFYRHHANGEWSRDEREKNEWLFLRLEKECGGFGSSTQQPPAAATAQSKGMAWRACYGTLKVAEERGKVM